MWLPDSARTSARGFKHRLITRGPPVRVPLHRLSREATEWCEAAVQEDVATRLGRQRRLLQMPQQHFQRVVRQPRHLKLSVGQLLDDEGHIF